jgi:hypothetical protein
MRRRTKNIPKKSITFQVTLDENEVIHKRFRATTYRYLCDYIRAQLQQKPVSIRCRNESLDEFLPFAIVAKDELTECGRNLTRAVDRLHQLQTAGQLRGNLEYYDAAEFSLHQKIDEIKSLLIKIHDKCLLK